MRKLGFGFQSLIDRGVLYWLLPLSFLVGLGVVLHSTRGMFGWTELIYVTLSWILVCCVGFFPRNALSSRDWNSLALFKVLSWVVVIFLISWVQNPWVDNNQATDKFGMLSYVAWLALGVSILLAVGSTFGIKIFEKRIHRGFMALAVLTVIARILTIQAVPRPFIDVFTTGTLGAMNFLKGLNPYSQKYPDIYGGFYDYVPTYVYWPGVVYFQTFAKLLFGDIRYAQLIADLITVFSLRRILTHFHWTEKFREAVPVMWLSFPVALFILQQSWVDPLLISMASLFFVFALEKKLVAAGISLGYFCAIKQYSIFFAILAAIAILFENDRPDWRSLGKMLLPATLTYLIVVGPFVIWDAQGIYYQTIFMPLSQKMRPDSLSIVAGAYQYGIEISGAMSGLIYLVALAAGCFWIWKQRGPNRFQAMTTALILIYGATFLFGKQAFCNYYYFLAFFVLLNFIMRPAPSSSPLGRGTS